MKLLPNEEKVLTSNDDKIILTNYRIQMMDKEWGQAFNISIFLEDISSIEVKYKSHIYLLIIGIICVLAGFYMGGQHSGSNSLIGGLVLGGIFIAIWWFTRSHVISIGSDGGSSLNFLVTGMSEDAINDFTDKLSLAKYNRVNLLQKIS